MKIVLAQQGVYHSIQGEGALLGLPMVLVRLASCPVACPECDTDYAPHTTVGLSELVALVEQAKRPATQWVWLTGGEPTLYDLPVITDALHTAGWLVAVATAGIRPVQMGSHYSGVDFLSVSPHSPTGWVQRGGTQLNLVPGLNGLRLADMEQSVMECQERFTYRYVTPCDGKRETLVECLDWVCQHPGWRFGVQAHKDWHLA